MFDPTFVVKRGRSTCRLKQRPPMQSFGRERSEMSVDPGSRVWKLHEPARPSGAIEKWGKT